MRVIEREYMHSAFPQIIYNICEFELALSRVRTVLLIDDFSEETRICDMVNPTLQYMEITFDPDERISATSAYYRPTIFPKICFFPSSYRWITTMTVSPILKSESS